MYAKLIWAACAAALLAAAPAAAKSPANPGKRQCFLASSVDGYRALDEHTLYIRAGVHDVYQFEMFGACPDINWNERLALVSRPGSWICSGMDAEVVTHSAIGPQRCPVRSVRKLTPEEIAALPRKARP
jgi:hypothetical protein